MLPDVLKFRFLHAGFYYIYILEKFRVKDLVRAKLTDNCSF